MRKVLAINYEDQTKDTEKTSVQNVYNKERNIFTNWLKERRNI